MASTNMSILKNADGAGGNYQQYLQWLAQGNTIDFLKHKCYS